MRRLSSGVLTKVLGSTLGLVLASSGCSTGELSTPDLPPALVPLAAALVSDPLVPGALVSAQAGTAYVSLPPGGFPAGRAATIRNPANGLQVVVPVVDGGWDPVPIAAEPGDTLRITITTVEGGVLKYAHRVPPVYRPVIVRTNPPPRKRDVPLNAAIVVVFSEPIDPATVTPQRVQLLNGKWKPGFDGQVLDATIELSADGLRITVRPLRVLAPNTDHMLIVSPALADLTGDRLEQGVIVEFTTGAPEPGTPEWNIATGVYDLTVEIKHFDPAWGYDLTGYRYTATLMIDEGPPGFKGTFANLQFGGPDGDVVDVAATGTVVYSTGVGGRVILDLVKHPDQVSSSFELTLVVANVTPERIEGTFGCCGHISGTFVALRRNAINGRKDFDR